MYRISETVRSTHSRDGAVLLDVRQGKIFNVNPVGSRILELIKTESDESAIVSALEREFEVNREVASVDVRDFLHALREHQLIDELESTGN
jgi:hypothetical protein